MVYNKEELVELNKKDIEDHYSNEKEASMEKDYKELEMVEKKIA